MTISSLKQLRCWHREPFCAKAKNPIVKKRPYRISHHPPLFWLRALNIYTVLYTFIDCHFYRLPLTIRKQSYKISTPALTWGHAHTSQVFCPIENMPSQTNLPPTWVFVRVCIVDTSTGMYSVRGRGGEEKQIFAQNSSNWFSWLICHFLELFGPLSSAEKQLIQYSFALILHVKLLIKLPE